ncbi:helix-turn-helix domain-containing protein [Parapedobacter pyrenivorans]|uniref:helix-turn-helix domain-containing protein n=1 Tax=Parapedobacter pyrenivorans TaxID=1305674 RepID=UPI003340CF9D
MQQPTLGKRLTALRKAKNLTQEELVEKSRVSVRTIQRIEAGEVLPRVYTVKILLAALGETYESFANQIPQQMETQQNNAPHVNRYTVLIAALAGAVFLVSETILGAMDIAWFTEGRNWGFNENTFYIALTVLMIGSYALFARGFIALGNLFENKLLKTVAYMLIVATAAVGVLDVVSLAAADADRFLLPYAVASVLFGALSIVFGISLIRLQDGMGELSRVAGILEIIVGCLLVTVVLFFVSYVIMIPAVVIEILILYRGYEYLSNADVSYNETSVAR